MKVERRSRLPATSKVAKNSHINSSSLMVLLLRAPKEIDRPKPQKQRNGFDSHAAGDLAGGWCIVRKRAYY